MAAAQPPSLQIDQEQEAALIAKYGMRPKLSPRLLAKVQQNWLSTPQDEDLSKAQPAACRLHG
jgi:hypothetical protein